MDNSELLLKIEKTIVKHSMTIESMDTSIKQLQKGIAALVDINTTLVKMTANQELLLEKISNIKTETEKGLDSVKKDITALEKVAERGSASGCEALKIQVEKENNVNSRLKQDIEAIKKRLDSADAYKRWFLIAVGGAILSSVFSIILK